MHLTISFYSTCTLIFDHFIVYHVLLKNVGAVMSCNLCRFFLLCNNIVNYNLGFINFVNFELCDVELSACMYGLMPQVQLC